MQSQDGDFQAHVGLGGLGGLGGWGGLFFRIYDSCILKTDSKALRVMQTHKQRNSSKKSLHRTAGGPATEQTVLSVQTQVPRVDDV